MYSPLELQWQYEAEQGRENRTYEMVAQLACWVISPWLGEGKSLKVTDLLRRGPQKPEPAWWDEE